MPPHKQLFCGEKSNKKNNKQILENNKYKQVCFQIFFLLITVVIKDHFHFFWEYFKSQNYQSKGSGNFNETVTLYVFKYGKSTFRFFNIENREITERIKENLEIIQTFFRIAFWLKKNEKWWNLRIGLLKVLKLNSNLINFLTLEQKKICSLLISWHWKRTSLLFAKIFKNVKIWKDWKMFKYELIQFLHGWLSLSTEKNKNLLFYFRL